MVQLKYYFSRKSIIKLLVDDLMSEDDYYDWSDSSLIQQANIEGYIDGIDKNKIYVFTDTGNIVEQKSLLTYN